jgi:starvation-inducible DNA-binding protein
MFETANDLLLGTRTRGVKLLNERLAHGIDLRSQIKHAHCNVKGPNLIARRERFDTVGAPARQALKV